jgi:hypothetical protein
LEMFMRWALGRCLGHILFFSLLDTIMSGLIIGSA